MLFVPFTLLTRHVRRAQTLSLIALLWMAGYLIALLGVSLLTLERRRQTIARRTMSVGNSRELKGVPVRSLNVQRQ